MTEWQRLLSFLSAGLQGTSWLEVVSVALNLAYSIFAVRRSRWCWIAGGVGSAILVPLSLQARLPMQAALQVYYVAVSVYGWWYWSAEGGRFGRPQVSTWPLRFHLVAVAAIVLISLLTGRWLNGHTRAAWPFLDSFTTWGSLYATWLEARVKLEHWAFWMVLDSILVVLFGAQGLYFFALLSIVYVGVSVVGLVRWLKSYRTAIAAG